MKFERYGFDELYDRRRRTLSPKRVPVAKVQRLLALYRENHQGFNVRVAGITSIALPNRYLREHSSSPRMASCSSAITQVVLVLAADQDDPRSPTRVARARRR